MKNEATGLSRLVSAAKFSIAGLKSCFHTEAAFRQEVFLVIVLTPVAVFISNSALEFSILIATLLLLLIVELLNTAIECVVDRIGSEYHELSGKAKDVGSAAVLLTILLLFIVWISIAIT